MSRVIRKKVKGAPEMAWVALELIKTDLVTRNEHLEATNEDLVQEIDYLRERNISQSTILAKLRSHNESTGRC